MSIKLPKEDFLRVFIPIDERAAFLEMDYQIYEFPEGRGRETRTHRESISNLATVGRMHIEKRTFGPVDKPAMPYRVYDADNQIITQGTALVHAGFTR